MTDRLLELAEQCQNAHSWSNQLDQAIALAVLGSGGEVRLLGMDEREPSVRLFRYPDGSTGTALRYSASLDAALTLIPEGHDWILQHVNGGLTIGSRVGHNDPDRTSWGDTAALALTAAALRARAAVSGAKDQ